MLPPFDLQGGLPIAAMRGATVGALLSAFGSLAFRVVVAPKAFARMPPACVSLAKRRILSVTQASIAAGVCAAGAWLVLQSASMADADTIAQAFAALPTVVGKTLFGQVITAQAAALLILAMVVGRRDRTLRQRAGLIVAMVALVLQAGHSHAFSMVGGPSLLLGAEILHLLGAGGWLGGLLPLILLLRVAPAAAGAEAARRFSPLGKLCIALLVISAAIQGWVLVASIPGLIGTAYGWLIQIKLVLFAILLGFAAANRYRNAPALRHGNPEQAKRTLIRSIVLQSGFAAAIVAAAAILSELPPSMHEQALWPFPDRLSLDAVREDSDFRREVLWAAASLGAAAALLVAALVARRMRWVAVAVAAATVWFAVPHFDLLLAEAYPTSFYHEPTGFMTADIVDGRGAYARNCVACHGAGGHGDGADAAALPVPPADLTAAHLWMHSDGELFWWIAHGIASPDGGLAMPGFTGTLDDTAIWSVIDFIRAQNAGDAMRRTGLWSPTIAAPGFGLTCGGRDAKLTQFRGHYVRLVFGDAPTSPGGEAVTIVASPNPARLAPDACATQDETVQAAYAVVSGIAASDLPGTQFLIDDAGLLRAMQLPRGAASWNDPNTLAATIAMLRAHPPGQTGTAAPMPMPMNMNMPS